MWEFEALIGFFILSINKTTSKNFEVSWFSVLLQAIRFQNTSKALLVSISEFRHGLISFVPILPPSNPVKTPEQKTPQQY
jgi:hypothetical protein